MHRCLAPIRHSCLPSRCSLTSFTLVSVLLVAILGTSGCRAIKKFGESRQSIAARRLSRQGLKAARQGDWTVAETLFSEALDVSGTNDAAHRGLAETLWQRGQRDDAINHMQQAVQLSAGDPKHLQRLGRMYLEVGRVDEAARQCEIALQSDRHWAALWSLWGDCELAHGNHEAALAAYHRALSLRPDYPYAQLQTAEIYHAEGRYDRLLATLDRVKEAPVDPQAGEMDGRIRKGRADLLRGLAMRQLGRTDEAIAYFAKAAEQNPVDATPRLQMAATAMELGRIEQAQQWLAQAMQADPTAVRESGMSLPAVVRAIDSPAERVAGTEMLGNGMLSTKQ